MGHYIYSTLAAPQAYTTYKKNDPKELALVESVVHIKGGTGIMEARNIQTPLGVMTEVTSDELKALMENHVFKMHLENGYITIEDKEKKVEKVAKDMNMKDKSRPLTPDDFEKGKDGKSGKLKRDDV
jgi:predicted class III extradiol MEMO1 family dioxygenase